MVAVIPWPEAERIVGTVVHRHYRQPFPAVGFDDLVQDGLERLWKASPHKDGVHLPVAVIGTIARRQLIDTLRQHHAVTHHRSLAVPLPLSIDTPGSWDRRGASECDRAALMDMADSLDGLSARDRFITLATACGWEHGEVARALGVAVWVVAYRHKVTRARLSQEVE